MSEDFDLKYKRQEAGMTDKKTGKTMSPFDKGTQAAKKLAKASTIGKIIGIPVALGAAAVAAYKDREDKKTKKLIDDGAAFKIEKEDDVYVMPNTSRLKAKPDSKRGGGMIIAKGNKLARSKPTKLY